MLCIGKMYVESLHNHGNSYSRDQRTFIDFHKRWEMINHSLLLPPAQMVFYHNLLLLQVNPVTKS